MDWHTKHASTEVSCVMVVGVVYHDIDTWWLDLIVT